jgi:uncharacterized membrane protein
VQLLKGVLVALLSVFVTVAFTVLVIVGLAYLMPDSWSTLLKLFVGSLGDMVTYIVIALVICLLLIGVFLLLQYIRVEVSDRRAMNSFPWELEEVSRRRLEETLRSLKGKNARRRFVARLESRRTLRVVGDWNDGCFPWLHNDDANDRLAVLDERWRGLARVPR